MTASLTEGPVLVWLTGTPAKMSLRNRLRLFLWEFLPDPRSATVATVQADTRDPRLAFVVLNRLSDHDSTPTHTRRSCDLSQHD